MQLVPPALVPAVQAYLAQQGQNPGIINGNGELDPGGVFGEFFNEIEVRTSLTPSLIFPIAAGGPPADPTMQALITSLQPVVTLRGRAGTVVVAPFGQSAVASSWIPIAVVAGVVVLGIGWLVWR